MAKKQVDGYYDLDNGEVFVPIKSKELETVASSVSSKTTKGRKRTPIADTSFITQLAGTEIPTDVLGAIYQDEKLVKYLTTLITTQNKPENRSAFLAGIDSIIKSLAKYNIEATQEEVIATILHIYKQITTKKDASKAPQLSSNAMTALDKHARNTIEIQLKKTPQYKTIQKQIELLTQNYEVYKEAGHQKEAEECLRLIKEQVDIKKKFIRFFKTGNQKEKTAEISEQIANSVKLKNLKDQKKELQEELNKINPATLYGRLRFLKKQFDGVNTVDELLTGDDVIDLDAGEDANFSEIEDNEAKTEYIQLCNHIAKLLDRLPDDIMMMRANEVKKELDATIDPAKIEELQDKIKVNQIEASAELKRLKGANDITDIMYELFDFKQDDQTPKELLASINIPYVKSIAYKLCVRNNELQYFEDSVSDGLYGLSVAINKWYEIQKFADSALSFEGFAYQYIVGSIQRGYYSRIGAGRISGSSLATIENTRKKEYQFFIKNNPEFKDLPPELIDSLAQSALTELPGGTLLQSEYENIVGGEEGGGDVWANALVDTEKPMDVVEAKNEFKYVVGALKHMFGTYFQTTTDKETGLQKITNKKLFDYEDYLIFLMYMKLKTKANGEPYNQKEMAEYITNWRLTRGNRQTMSQPAINDRLDKMFKNKIGPLMKKDPQVKAAFEYIYYNRNEFQTLAELANYNSYGKIDTQIDQLDTKQQVSDYMKQKTIGNVFDDIDDTNPIELQISQLLG